MPANLEVDPPFSRPWLPLVLVLLFTLGLATIFWLGLRRRSKREFDLDEEGDVSRILQGALQQPQAFRHLDTVFKARLIPLINGSALSLEDAHRLARRGRLYTSGARRDLARRAQKGGAAILDHRRPPARVVAQALGAIDLDAWETLLAGTQTGPVIDDANRLLALADEAWTILAQNDVPGGVATLDLGPLGVRVHQGPATRVIVVERSSDEMTDVERRHVTRPAEATFDFLDDLLGRVAGRGDGLSRVLRLAGEHLLKNMGQSGGAHG
jgi:hypothetical protein